MDQVLRYSAILWATGVLLAGQTEPSARTAAMARPGTTKLNPKDGLTYVWIPPGTFGMGCSAGDAECFGPEGPAHQVTISRGFWMGQTEVTQEAWQRVMGTAPSNFKGDKRPVENITWDDAQHYCQAVGMRLPTEAEWEYAARAGSTASRYSDVDSVAWHSGNSQAKTHEVALKQPNAWLLYDMLGNVWEWVSDWYADQYLPIDQTDPTGPGMGATRVRRGGSWDTPQRYSRASFRSSSRTSYRFSNLGVRCVGN
ncbi:MAG TPA: formylglycine-generating enzyme family protein [Bryobacteraceae bacterium]|nr:formylglycine-generating enzyme family protein [Bryobacteraceae bacterium]